MKKLLKFLLWFAVMAVLLLLAAHFTLRHALNTPKFKAAATGFIERATGRVATYDRIDYRLFPFSLVIRKADLKEADGTTTFASIEEFAAVVDFRRKELQSLRLKEPVVRIVQYADGSFNFSDLVAPEPEQTQPDAAPTEPAEPSKPETAETAAERVAAEPFAISLVQIDRARLEFVRVDADSQETPFTLSEMNFELIDFAPDQPFLMKGEVIIGKQSAFDFSLSGPALAEYAERLGEWPVKLSARVDIRDFADLKAFLPADTLPFHSLHLDLDLGGSLAEGLQLRAELDTPDATETFPVAMNLDLKGDLALPGPVIQHLLAGTPLPENLQAPSPPCERPPGTMALTHLPMESLLLRHSQAEATLTFPMIAYGLNRFEDGSVTARLADGVLTFPAVNMNAYTGTIEAEGRVRLLDCPLTYHLDRLSANGLEIDQVVAANGIESLESFSGTIRIDADAEGAAVAEDGLNTLKANAKVRIDDLQSVGDEGSLMDKVWLQLDHPLLMKLAPGVKGKVDHAKHATANVTTSHYDEATAVLALDNEVVTISKMRLSATHYLFALSGTVRPFDDTLDLKAQVRFSAEETRRLTKGQDLSDYLPFEHGGLVVPVAITGSMKKPTVLPDLDRLLKNALSGPVTDKIGSSLEKLSDKEKQQVGEGLQLLQGLFK